MRKVTMDASSTRATRLTTRQVPVMKWIFESVLRVPPSDVLRLGDDTLTFSVAQYGKVWDGLGDAVAHGKRTGNPEFWRAAENIRRKLDPKYKPN